MQTLKFRQPKTENPEAVAFIETGRDEHRGKKKGPRGVKRGTIGTVEKKKAGRKNPACREKKRPGALRTPLHN